jgi:M6 family metalloprotease-like protein
MKSVLVWILLLVSTISFGNRVEGVLIYEFGDAQPPAIEHHENYYLQTTDQKIPVSLSDAFEKRMPIRAWAGKKVAITFKNINLMLHRENPIQAMELLEGDAVNGGNISGAQPWVSILCKFNDVNDEPENLNFFQDMYANQPAGLDHYWREVSYDQVNVVGSLAVDWVDLPLDRIDYIPVVDGDPDADLDLLFDDCVDAADPFVNYATGANGNPFVGINMMFNDDLDCCAWGGGRYATLDGLFKLWRTTWNPPWSFANEGVIAHEMGHGFGLPHANNSDGDGNPYDSPWDVMSSATGYAVNDNIYGRLGKHINMHFKHQLGWVNDSDGFIADSNTDNEVVFINYSSRGSLTATGKRFVRIPASNGTHYMVEVRKAVGNYESNIVDTAVIIHNVANCRSEPPWVVDADNPPANYSDNEGVMWKVGETFVDPIDDFSVEVLNVFNNGFNVRLTASNDLIVRRNFDDDGCL